MGGIKQAQKTWLSEKSVYSDLIEQASLDEDSIKINMLKELEAANPNYDPDQIMQLAMEELPRRLERHRRVKDFVSKADVSQRIQEAEQGGAGYLPPEMGGELERSPPSKADRFLDIISASGRAPEAGVASAIGKARELTHGAPMERREPTVWTKAQQALIDLSPLGMIQGAMTGSMPGAKALTEQVGLPSLGQLMTAPEVGGQVAGVPVRALVKDPGNLLKVLEAGFNAAADQISTGDWRDASLRDTLQDVYDEYTIAALKIAETQVAPEQVEAHAKQLREQMLEEDTGRWAVEHPATAQFMSEVGLDPLSYLPSGTIAKGAKYLPQAGKVGKAVHYAGGALPGGVLGAVVGDTGGMLAGAGLGTLAKTPAATAALRKGFKHMHFLKDAPEEAGQAARLSRESAQEAARVTLRQFEDAEYKYFGKLSEQDTGVVFDLLNGTKKLNGQRIIKERQLAVPLGDIEAVYGAKVSKAISGVMDEIEPLHREYMQITGSSKHWVKEGDKTVLREMDVLSEGYVPWKVRRKGFERGEIIEQFVPHQTTLDVSAAKSRKSLSPRMYEPNVRVQFKAAMHEALPKGAATKELLDLAGDLEKRGALHKVSGDALKDIVKMPRREQQAYLETLVKTVGKRTGQEMVVLRTYARPGPYQKIDQIGKVTLEDVLVQASGKVGTVRGEELLIVPKWAAEVVQEVAPYAQRPAAITSAVGEYWNRFVRPVIHGWKISKTSIMGPVFAVPNALGGATLSVLGMGIRALSPKHQLMSVAGSIAGALGKPELLEKLPKWMRTVTSRTGAKFDLADAYRAMMKTGKGSQMVALTGGEMDMLMRTARGAGKEASVLERGLQLYPKIMENVAAFGNKPYVRNVSPAMMATASENYQHFVTFLGFLDDLTDASIARALDLSSKYSGNYNRLTKFEKTWLRDVFGFYNWSRFIGPHILTQMVENPARLSAFLKSRKLVEQSLGIEDRYGWAGMSGWMREHAIMAPEFLQPDDPNKFTALWVEDPLSMGLSVLKSYGFGWLGDSATKGNELAMSLGPVSSAVAELITGRDLRTGRELDLEPHYSRGWLKNQLWGLIDRPSEAVMDMINLMFDAGRPDQANRIWLQYAAMRYLTGAKVYPQAGPENIVRQKRRALSRFQKQMKSADIELERGR
jgi:hypothetical protein